MSFYNADEFIKYFGDKTEDAIRYDFKRQCNSAADKTDADEKENLKEWIKYKADHSPYKNFDCDSCCLAIEIYKRLWDYNGNKMGVFGPDTINSFFNIFKAVLDTFLPEEKKEYFKGIENKMFWSQNDHEWFLNNYETIKSKIDENVYSELSQFASLTHTIGNLTLFPNVVYPGEDITFRTYRGRVYKDYFDLSLNWLRKNYDKYDDFIERFYLSCYTDENNYPIPLFGDDIDRVSDPDPHTETDILQCLQNINAHILSRGRIVYGKLLSLYDQRSTLFPTYTAF